MITSTHDAVSSQKDKSNVTCCYGNREVMSTMQAIQINGCSVTMTFADKTDPTIGQAVAEMLIESFMRRCARCP